MAEEAPDHHNGDLNSLEDVKNRLTVADIGSHSENNCYRLLTFFAILVRKSIEKYIFSNKTTLYHFLSANRVLIRKCKRLRGSPGIL